MYISLFGKHITADHLSVGPRRSGSWNLDGAEEYADLLEADPEVRAWAETAEDGDEFPLGPGTFLHCWGLRE